MVHFAETTFRGVPYRLQRLPRLEAARLALAVGAIIAAAADGSDAITTLIASAKKGDGEQTAASMVGKITDDAQVINALAGGVAKLDTDALYSIGLKCINGLFGPTGKLGDNELLEAHFDKYPDHLLPIMAWAIKENCLGFFVKSVQG